MCSKVDGRCEKHVSHSKYCIIDVYNVIVLFGSSLYSYVADQDYVAPSSLLENPERKRLCFLYILVKRVSEVGKKRVLKGPRI